MKIRIDALQVVPDDLEMYNLWIKGNARVDSKNAPYVVA
jgi:hypothetical protein